MDVTDRFVYGLYTLCYPTHWSYSPTSTLSDAHALDDDEWHQYVIKNTDMLLPVNVPSSLDE